VYKVICFNAGDVPHIFDVQAVGSGCYPLLHPDQVIWIATQPICLEILILPPLPRAQHPAMSRGSCTLRACTFTYIKSNAEAGH
jgi:hypothetical protein